MIKYALMIISTKTKFWWYQYFSNDKDEVDKSVKNMNKIMENSDYIYVCSTLNMTDNNNNEPNST